VSHAIDTNSLALFYRDVKKVDTLSREEETRLALRWHEQKDRDAAKELVVSNLPGVAAIAREYRHFGLQEMDLIQEGTMGLMHAVKRFDPHRGFRLMTYASWWIRASIHDYILHSWSIVKLGTNKLQRRIFAGLQKARNTIAAMEGTKVDEVAAEYGVDGNAYQEVASAFLQRDLSLDIERDGENITSTLPSAVASPEEQVTASNWQTFQEKELHAAMQALSERDRYIVVQRHLSDPVATLKELANDLGISIERVRQLEKRAMAKIKEHFAT